MEADYRQNVPALRSRFALLPNLRDLLIESENDLLTIASAWQLGATKWSDPPPLIQLVLADVHSDRLAELESGLPTLGLSHDQRNYFKQRLVTEMRGGYAPAIAALTELMVGARLQSVGAEITFVKTGQERTPDLEARRDGTTLTLELTAIHESDSARNEADMDQEAFWDWNGLLPVPERLRGRASGRDGVRILEGMRHALGPGNPAERAGRLSRKLRTKANWGQLNGRPSPVLVVGYWHEFGIHAGNFSSSHGVGEPTPIFREALYGAAGDQMTEEAEFNGARLNTCELREDGVLTSPGDAAALLWLFQNGTSMLAKRAEGVSPALDPAAERLLVDAFRPAITHP